LDLLEIQLRTVRLRSHGQVDIEKCFEIAVRECVINRQKGESLSASKEQNLTLPNAPTRRRRVADYLGLERNVAVVSTAVFLLGLGEELWKKFLPKYLEHLGGGPVVIGLFG